MGTSSQLKVGIIGGGMITAVHGPVILGQPNATLVGIADKDPARARALAAQLKTGAVYADAAAMIDEQRPDVVHVLTPPATHADVSVMAMEKGCHVLVEKPMSLALKDAQRMADAARRCNVKLCVNHNMVYEATVRRVRDLVAAGSLGEIVSADAYFSYNIFRNPALVEDGAELVHWAYRLNGGPLQDQMPHMASLVFEFVPALNDVRFVQLQRGALPKPWPDEIRVVVDGGKATGSIAISFNERPDTILLTLRGTRGAAQANLFNGILTIQKQSQLPRAATRGMSGFQAGFQNLRGAVGNVWNFAMGRMDKTNGIQELVTRFYRSIREGTEVPVSVEKSLRVVDLMERIWPTPVVPVASTAPSVSTKTRRPPTALVTGASGFLGSHLVKKLLAEDVGVRAVIRPTSIHAGRMKKFDIETVSADLADADALKKATEGIKVIYHVGSAMNNSWHDHEESTIKGTRTLIEAALANNVDRIVFVSTLAVYDLLSFPDGGTIREDAPYQADPKAMGPYAACKIEAEKMLLEAHRQHGLKVTIVRPGIIIGPTGRVFFPHLGLKNGDTLFIVLGSGRNVLPLTYVDNTVDAMVLAASSDKAAGQIYNLIDEGQVTINDYLQSFVKTTGIPSKIIHVPYVLPYCAFGMYELVSAMGLLKKGITSRKQLKWKTKAVLFDSSKARNDFGWKPSVSLPDGMRKTFEWYAAKFGTVR